MALGRQEPGPSAAAGKRLAEGEELLLSRREEVDDQIVDYIEASSSAQKAAAEKERQAERRASRPRRRPSASAWSARRSAGAWRQQRRRGSRGAPGSRRPSRWSWRSGPEPARSSGSGVSRRRSGRPNGLRKTPARPELRRRRRELRRRRREPPRPKHSKRETGPAQSIALALVSLATDCRERRHRGRNPAGAGSAADQHVGARPAVSARSGGGPLQSALRAPANHGLPP